MILANSIYFTKNPHSNCQSVPDIYIYITSKRSFTSIQMRHTHRQTESGRNNESNGSKTEGEKDNARKMTGNERNVKRT